MKVLKHIFVILSLVLTLFSVSCEKECQHKNMTETTSSPTCTEAGKTVYSCPDCSLSYVDAVKDPTGHSFEKKIHSPTCDTEGYTTYTCACGFSYNADYTSPKGHTITEAITQPTCEDKGYTTYSCSDCEFSYISSYTEPTGHTISEHVSAPTCEDKGYITYSCSDCEFSYISSYTEPTGHTISEVVTPPTCEDKGYSTYSCENCEYSYISKYTDPVGHTHTEEIISVANCTEKGEIKYTCACGDSYSLITAPLGHDFGRKVTMPTVSDMGYTVFDCDNCDFFYTGDYLFYRDFFDGAHTENTEVVAHGIDVSHHQYAKDGNDEYIPLDWDAVKSSGIDYVIIRVGDTSIGLDKTFEISYSGAKAAGLDAGAYFYTRAQSVEEIRLEAYLVLSSLSGKQFEYPIYLDVEDSSLRELPRATLTEMCYEFCSILQRAGYYTGIYVNDEWLNDILQTEVMLSKFEIWYARYTETTEGEFPVWNIEEYGKHVGMWQYSDSGTVDGITANVVDLNFCYKDYPSIIKEYGFSGYDADFEFVDSGKTFVTIIHDKNNKQINVRSKSDYFTTEGYDAGLDIIGTASYGERYEVIEIADSYIAINYKGQTAYITSNESYVSVTNI